MIIVMHKEKSLIQIQFYMNQMKQEEKLAVNIDIFVYDNAPNDEIKTKKMFDKRDFYRRLNVAHSQRCDIIGGKKRNLVFGILRIITMPFSHNFFALKMVRKFSKIRSSRFG